jgi:hypothetical protein
MGEKNKCNVKELCNNEKFWFVLVRNVLGAEYAWNGAFETAEKISSQEQNTTLTSELQERKIKDL